MSWRRYARFSVRGMVVVVLLIGGSTGWIVRQAHIQRDAVAAIASGGGDVLYEGGKWGDSKSSLAGKAWVQSWVADAIGVDFTGHVSEVAIGSRSAAADALLEHVGRLTCLQELRLDRSFASDAGIAHLSELTELQYLGLSGTRVSDAGMAHLTGLSKLAFVDLERTSVSNAGLCAHQGDDKHL